METDVESPPQAVTTMSKCSTLSSSKDVSPVTLCERSHESNLDQLIESLTVGLDESTKVLARTVNAIHRYLTEHSVGEIQDTLCEKLLTCLLEKNLPLPSVFEITECLNYIVDGSLEIQRKSQDLLEFVKRVSHPWVQVQLLELCFRCNVQSSEFNFECTPSDNLIEKLHSYLLSVNHNADDRVINLQFSELAPFAGLQSGWIDFGFESLLVCFTVPKYTVDFISVNLSEIRTIQADDQTLELIFERDNQGWWKAGERISFHLVHNLSKSVAETIQNRLTRLEHRTSSAARSSIAVFQSHFSHRPDTIEPSRSLWMDESDSVTKKSIDEQRRKPEKNMFSSECAILSDVLSLSVEILTKKIAKQTRQCPKLLKHVTENLKEECFDESNRLPMATKRSLLLVQDRFHGNMRHFKAGETAIHHALVKIERDQYQMGHQLSDIQSKIKKQLQLHNDVIENELQRLRTLLRSLTDG